jgi:hypothetical protein
VLVNLLLRGAVLYSGTRRGAGWRHSEDGLGCPTASDDGPVNGRERALAGGEAYRGHTSGVWGIGDAGGGVQAFGGMVLLSACRGVGQASKSLAGKRCLPALRIPACVGEPRPQRHEGNIRDESRSREVYRQVNVQFW